MTDRELEKFKHEINLTEFAAWCGYAVDARKSWGSSVVMRSETDKITVTKIAGGHWVFCSNYNPDFHGTIIDFCQKMKGGNFGQVRKNLREWLGSPRLDIPAAAWVRNIKPIKKDRAAAVMEFERARIAGAIPCLTARGITPDILRRPEFAGCVRIDERKNAIFGHYDKEGVCGFEKKNKGFTGFSSGACKGLWFSKVRPGAAALVIAESAIDALSFAALHPDLNARFLSTGGTLNPNQPDLIRAALDKMPRGAAVFLAFDNDEGGDKLADQVRGLAPDHMEVKRALPPNGLNDWNDALKQARGIWEAAPLEPSKKKPLHKTLLKPA